MVICTTNFCRFAITRSVTTITFATLDPRNDVRNTLDKTWTDKSAFLNVCVASRTKQCSLRVYLHVNFGSWEHLDSLFQFTQLFFYFHLAPLRPEGVRLYRHHVQLVDVVLIICWNKNSRVDLIGNVSFSRWLHYARCQDYVLFFNNRSVSLRSWSGKDMWPSGQSVCSASALAFCSFSWASFLSRRYLLETRRWTRSSVSYTRVHDLKQFSNLKRDGEDVLEASKVFAKDQRSNGENCYFQENNYFKGNYKEK